MDPYLRPARPDGQPPAACPPGHLAEPAGLWGRQHMEVVYDPSLHDVCIVRGRLGDAVGSGLRGAGWQPRQSADGTQMWIRDRAAAARAQLATTGSVAPSPHALGR